MLDKVFTHNIKRRSFGKISHVASIPNLVEVQRESYEKFLQFHSTPDQRKEKGLQSVFKSMFPIEDNDGLCTLEFVSYRFDSPKYNVDECKQRSISFSAPLKAVLRLILWDIDPDTNAREIKGIKEQEVYLGDIPLMTEGATFVINGVERVIVSQMHRSPGVFFDHDKGKTHITGKFLYSARIIPYRGSWLDFEFDGKDVLYFRIDRRRKLPASALLRALEMDTQGIYDFFYDKIKLEKTDGGWSTEFNPDETKSVRLIKDLIDAKTKKPVLKAGDRLNRRLINKLKQDGLKNILLDSEDLSGKALASGIKTKSITLNVGDELSESHIKKLEADASITSIEVLDLDKSGPYIMNTLKVDKSNNQEEALIDIFRVLRPGEPITFETSKLLFNSLFFDKDRYDLSDVGRVKMNSRLQLHLDEKVTVLTKEDILQVVKQLVELRNGIGEIDDIDNLGNRRIRAVGELIENQFRLGLVRMERTIVERIGALELDTIMPSDLVNPKILVNVIKEFFGTSQLSQFMDQTNPLSEITHKRRVSALGPGGLTRDRAGVEVRDVHITHYGRICPIETPEGQNIGLINSLASFAKVNKYGFIETPYRRVKNGIVLDETVYLSAMEEAGHAIAQSTANIDADGKLTDSLISCRKDGNLITVAPEDVEFMDVDPGQMMSVATALIPFLENDDANRALMGSNMQRQAVPLLSTCAPFVGTGIEDVVARDAGVTLIARHDGVVDRVESTRVVVKYEHDGVPGVDIYNLSKFQRSNYSTCINQRPLVKSGDIVRVGDTIADGPSTDRGDLALGKNVLVAFMPWGGYNFEDSIIISERVVSDDTFTSIHIEVFSTVARDTRLGPEEITRDIPSMSEDRLEHLDEAGIVRVGAEVRAGDILVGKVTPKSESPMTPEEKLLRAIFGEKAAEVKDSSLHVPPGVSGTVIEVRVFSRRGIEKDQRAIALERQQIQKVAKDRDAEIAIIEDFVFANLKSLLVDKAPKSKPADMKVGKVITQDILDDCSKGSLWKFAVDDKDAMEKIVALKKQYETAIKAIEIEYNNKVEKIQAGDDLPQSVLKEVKVFIAMKHKLQPGDKMSGRHGNKGVISKIVPEEDMPYLEDGTVVDIILNPLGVPSRMNIGQILETHLGWASVNLGKKIARMLEDHSKAKVLRDFINKIYQNDKKVLAAVKEASDQEVFDLGKKLSTGIFFATPVFDGANVADIDKELELADVDKSGQAMLIDGRTGEYFDRPVTVGYIYMLKLHHLVDDKIHARSIGPYSLVTQQPLGGKSHFGGQRFGEMECWALQAYGAAYTLQEMLTVKSDDVVGRVKIFESIVRNDNNFECGTPESFNVMVKELRSLCLNVELENLGAGGKK